MFGLQKWHRPRQSWLPRGNRNRGSIEMTDMNRTFVGAQGLVRMALDQYTEILTTISDPRVSDWPLMDSPIPTFLIVLLYLYGVTIFGPRVMVNRKPFKLRTALVAYNAFQVVFSLGMLYEVRIYCWYARDRKTCFCQINSERATSIRNERSRLKVARFFSFARSREA